MEFDFDRLGRDDGDMAQAIAAARPRPRHRLDKPVILDHLMGDEKVQNGLLPVVDVGLRVVAFHGRDHHDRAGYVMRALLAQNPSRVTFPVAVNRRLGAPARLLVFP
jgi:hypothetical protein